MNLGPKDKKSLQTWPGFILSVLMIAYMGMYISYKINFVIYRNGQQVLQTVKEDFYVEENSIFSNK